MPKSSLSRGRRERLRRRERELRHEGYARIAGADEVGAGPLAGPLVAAAVILPPRARLPGVDDSKRLDPASRQAWAAEITRLAVCWSIAEVTAAEVDRVGPYQGSLIAMRRAVDALDPAPDYLLVDARRLPGLTMPQEAVIRGDGEHLVIAAASIIAKVARDAQMVELSRRFPGYGFERHKGYGTAEHLAALERLGPCAQHRRRFAPVRRLTSDQGRLF